SARWRRGRPTPRGVGRLPLSSLPRLCALTAFPGVTVPEHVALLGLVDEYLHVGGQQEAVLPELLGDLRHRLHLALVVLVALLERAPRITDRDALGLRRRKGDVLAVRLAAVVGAEPRPAQRPAGGGGDRRRDLGQADAGLLVAVLIHLRHENGVRGP